jgi:hypothetical protein
MRRRRWGDAPGLIRRARFGNHWIVACNLCPKSRTGAPRNFAWPRGDIVRAVEILAAHQRARYDM